MLSLSKHACLSRAILFPRSLRIHCALCVKILLVFDSGDEGETFRHFAQPLLHAVLDFGRRLAKAHDHEITLRNDDDELSFIAIGRERAGAGKVEPPMCAVAPLVGLLLPGGRARVIDPAFRKNARTFPDTIAQIEKAEARKIARCRKQE